MAALAAPPSMPAPQPPGADRKKPRLSRKARREQSRAWLSAAAAAEQAASVPAEAAEAEAPPAPHVAVEVVSDAEAPRPLAPPLTERTDASRSDFSDGDALHSNDSAAWPLPVRATAVAATQLLVWLTQLWAVVAGIALVAPLAALHVALPALFARPLAVMRAVAQRPLVVMSIAVAAPLYLAEFSWGIDFDAMPERPTSMPDLVRALKNGSSKRWNARVRQARAQVEAAGMTVEYVPASRFAPGVSHRRVLLSHVWSHNPGALSRAIWLATGVAALHSLHGDCVEFRDASTNALQAFSLVITQGGYCAGALYACRSEVSRAGVWATNAAVIMEQCVMAGGALHRVRCLDVGPTFAALKGHLGMHALPWRRTLRVAAFSRALRE